MDELFQSKERFKSTLIDKRTCSSYHEQNFLAEYKAVFCLTIYNEPSSMLRSSLNALQDNIKFRREKREEQERYAIVLISDGIDNLDDSSLAFLKQIGFDFSDLFSNGDVGFDFLSIDDSNKSTFHDETILLNDICISANKIESSIDIILTVKKSNKGKLDSHQWFYAFICEILKPEICFQIDAGSIPTIESVHNIIEEFEKDSSVNAVSPRTMLPELPKSGLLHWWQYASFSVSNFQIWPAEMLTGHMSVIPGQFSALKYSAFSEKSSVDEKNILDIYLRGLNENISFLDKTLYLAEDRVLATEINFGKGNKGRIKFCDEAQSTTDYCESWIEILGQRRRWNLSYISSRLGLLKNALCLDLNTGFSERLKRVPTVVLQSSNMIVDWFFPCLYLGCMIALLGVGLNNHVEMSSGTGGAYNFFAITTSALLSISLASTLLFSFLRLSKNIEKILVFNMYFQTFFLVFLSANALSHSELNSSFHIIMFLAASIFFIPLIMAFLSRKDHDDFHYFLINHVGSFAFRPAIGFMLWSYAVINCNDLSWGTKGLTGVGAKHSLLKEEVKFKYVYVGSWIISNLLLMLFIGMMLDFSALGYIALMLLILSSYLSLNILFGILYKFGVRFN